MVMQRSYFCLVEPFIGLRVRHVRDVLKAAGRDHHVVGHVREAQHAGSPHVIVILSGLHRLLPCKFLPLTLELFLGALEVSLASL